MVLALLTTAAHSAEEVVIGVLSHRGDAATMRAWGPTADYLNTNLPEYRFRIEPLDFDEVEPSVAQRQVDFLLVNSGIYVSMEALHGVSRIATLNNRRSDERHYNTFGGVIFTRADRTDLRELTDLRHARFAAVHEISLGGFQMAWRELQALGINPYRDFSQLDFLEIHDDVVRAVIDGRYDAGTVRTDILERMVQDGALDAGDIRIINAQQRSPEFPFARSTRLYPEWPFAKLRDTPTDLAQEVAVQLLKMPREHAAARAGRYAGWTVPLDYQPVHDLFEELAIGPYAKAGRFTFTDVLARYRYVFIAGMLVLITLGFLVTRVTRLNRALERAKAGLERRYELILNSVGEGIYGVDLDGRSTFVNAAMEHITGWCAEDLIGHSQHDLLHHTRADGSPHPREECPIRRTMIDGEPRHKEDVFWHKDGSCIPVEYTAAPIKDGTGQTVGAVVVFRDISERQRLEEQERDRQAELAHVARLNTMGEMATTIAHELNQPLAAIANYTSACARMIRAGESSDKALLQALNLVTEQAQRAGAIIRRIRAFIRKAEPAPAAVNLNDLVRNAVSLITPEARRQDVHLTLNLDPHLPPVPAHGIEVEQVILNLVRNAIDAMSGERTTAAGLSRDLDVSTDLMRPGILRVSVRDTGPGLSDAAQNQVFDPFFTTKPTGMGLGLSISRRIIESHGGRLWAEQNDGRGATFHFVIPEEAKAA